MHGNFLTRGGGGRDSSNSHTDAGGCVSGTAAATVGTTYNIAVASRGNSIYGGACSSSAYYGEGMGCHRWWRRSVFPQSIASAAVSDSFGAAI